MAVDPEPSKMAVIRENVVEGAALPHRHPRPVGVVVLFHRAGAARPLKVIAHVDGGGAAEGGLDPVAVAVVDKRGAGCAAHARQTVLGVVGQMVDETTPHSETCEVSPFPSGLVGVVASWVSVGLRQTSPQPSRGLAMIVLDVIHYGLSDFLRRFIRYCCSQIRPNDPPP
jgi:hypothetical protein